MTLIESTQSVESIQLFEPLIQRNSPFTEDQLWTWKCVKTNNVYTGRHLPVEVTERGELWCWFVPLLPPNTTKSPCKRVWWLHFVLFISTTFLQDFLPCPADFSRTLLTDLTDSCLSLLKAILLPITGVIALTHYFPDTVTSPRDLKLERHHRSPTQSHGQTSHIGTLVSTFAEGFYSSATC